MVVGSVAFSVHRQNYCHISDVLQVWKCVAGVESLLHMGMCYCYLDVCDTCVDELHV